MASKEHMSDDYVADALKKDARESTIKYSTLGLEAMFPKRPTNAAPKPNTRFLKNIIQETDTHNAALKVKELGDAARRLRGLSKSVNDRKDIHRLEREDFGHRSTRKGEEFEDRPGRRARDRSIDTSSQDERDRKRRKRRIDASYSSDTEEEDYRRKRRKYRDDRRRSRSRERRRDRNYSRSGSPRSYHSDTDEEDYRRTRRRHRKGKHWSRSKARRRGRSRSRSSDTYSSNTDKEEYRKKSRRHRNNRHRSRSKEKRRERSHSRSPRHHSQRHHQRHSPEIDIDSAFVKARRRTNDAKHSKTRSEKQSNGYRERNPQKSRSLHAQAQGSHKSQVDGADSDPLEAIVGPPLPEQPPKIRPRGRGALAALSGIDSRFSKTYDPSTDVQVDDDVDDDWGMALEALRDREKWKQQGADRLRAAGFSTEEISKWEKSDEKTEEDVVWKKKGEGREWDQGKVVDADGHIEHEPPEWGRLKGS